MKRWPLALILWACADAPVDDPCQSAADHLAACTGEAPAGWVQGCDPDDAAAIAAATCAELSEAVEGADRKGDGGGIFGRAACRMGFYAACPTPACVPESDRAPPEAGDACREHLRYDGCGVCGYYRCREVEQPCGGDGYLLGYAGRYCERFALVTEPQVSPAASAWLMRVRRCLVERLDTQVPTDVSCETLWTKGTRSHVECYLDTGFCGLSPKDWFDILRSIDLGDVPLRTLLSTGSGCVGEWLDG